MLEAIKTAIWGRKIVVHDPVFGRLEARSKDLRLAPSATAGPKAVFEAFGRELPLEQGRPNLFHYVKITGSTSGPTDTQRRAFLKLVENFREVREGIKRDTYLAYFRDAIIPHLNLNSPVQTYDDIVALGLHAEEVDLMDVVPSYIDADSYIGAMKYVRIDIDPENKVGLFMETVNHVRWQAEIEDGCLVLTKSMN